MGTLGHILELATGKPYEELLKQAVCEPVGLTDTGYTLFEEQQGRMMYAYDSEGQPLPNWCHDVMLSQGGLRSTLSDVLTFVEANYWSSLDPDESPLCRALRRTREQHAEQPPPASPRRSERAARLHPGLGMEKPGTLSPTRWGCTPATSTG